jgi:hypothetical protein
MHLPERNRGQASGSYNVRREFIRLDELESPIYMLIGVYEKNNNNNTSRCLRDDRRRFWCMPRNPTYIYGAFFTSETFY